MKVDPAGNQPIRSTVPEASIRSAPRPAALPSQSASEGMTGRLADALRTAGAEASPSKLLSLASELDAIGFSASKITPEIALRALFLSNNSVKLTPGLLTDSQDTAETLFSRVENLRTTVRMLLTSGRIPANLREAVAALARDLDALGGTPIFPSGATVAAGSGTALLPGGMLTSQSDSGALLLASAAGIPGSAAAEGVESLLRKSGATFERNLLAWYRAGGDPGSLDGLVRGDLKGALLSFLASMEAHRFKARPSGALKSLEDGARSLVDNLTSGQITHLADNAGERRSLVLDLPFGPSPEKMYARVNAEGKKEPDSKLLDTGRVSLVFRIETSHLGAVSVHLAMHGKTISAAVYLRDEETKALAADMAGEFRGFLAGRGYEPGLIRFGIAGEEGGTKGAGGKPRRSVNVKG
jgi:hypothetical protein